MNPHPPESPPLRVLIVDDESFGRDVVRHMLRSHADVTIVGEAANGTRALEEIRAKRPDLVFLDINMPKMNGLEILAALAKENPPAIVFTTAHDEYAVQAFERCALDYLLKPFDQERFDAALSRVRRFLQGSKDADFGRRLRELLASNPAGIAVDGARASEREGQALTRFVLKEASRVSFVAVESVDWLEASGNYVGLHVGTKTHLIHQALAEIERGLDPQAFLRIHRSTIVNVKRIRELQPYANGEFVVILHDGTRLKLSRSFRERANAVLGLG
jgi:two-component system, LytTR family, response regulator